MRYIQKSQEPRILTNFKNVKYPKFRPSFDNIPPQVLKGLIEALLQDQGYLCCYTMDEITPETAELVHFYPYKYFEGYDLDYENMYVAMRQPESLPPKYRVGQACKGEAVIPNYLSDIRCSNYFRYNTLGEMLPAGTFRTVKKCRDNFRRLTPEQQTVFCTIELLNLNAEQLKQQRKTILTQVTNAARKMTKGQIKQVLLAMQQKDKEGKYRRFCDVMIYYLAHNANMI